MLEKDSLSTEKLDKFNMNLVPFIGTRPSIVIERGRGSSLWDVNGKVYIDANSSAYAQNIGHCHPEVIKAAKMQIDELTHVAVIFDTIPLIEYTNLLLSLLPSKLNKINYCLEGSVAVEGALKLALKNCKEGKYFISFEHGYHGRTIMGLAASWPHPPASFLGYMENFIRLPEAYCYRCSYKLKYPACGIFCAEFIRETIKNRINGKVAAIIMEPVQGNGGQIDFPIEFYSAIRSICDELDVLLIWDEVQTGFGRLGKMFAIDYYGVIPDIMVFGKAAGGGFPLAGFVARGDLEPFDDSDHAFTFGQFTPSLAAAIANVEVIKKEDLLKRCEYLGGLFTSRLKLLKEIYPIIGNIRGPGLAIGIELVKEKENKVPAVDEAQYIVKRGLELGVIFGIDKYNNLGHVVKIKPPLVTTDEEAETILDVFEKLLKEVGNL